MLSGEEGKNAQVMSERLEEKKKLSKLEEDEEEEKTTKILIICAMARL